MLSIVVRLAVIGPLVPILTSDWSGPGGVRVPVPERAVELQRQQRQQAHPADHRQG